MMLSVLLSAIFMNIYANDNSNLLGSDLSKQSKESTFLITGVVSGNITDCNTGIGISNVLVEADDGTNHYEVESDQNGDYTLTVEASTYSLQFNLLGYQEVIYNNVVVSGGQTKIRNTQLCENANPVSNVYANPDLNCPGVTISWDLPAGPYAIIYDDNSAEDYSIWNQAGGEIAVEFTPGSYPATLTGGKIYVGDGSFPAGGNWLGTTMEIGVLDDDGLYGLPGSVLETDTVTVDNYGWVLFQGVFSSEISEGSFYIYYKQLHDSPNAAPIGVDGDLPIVYQSYVKQAGGSWVFSPYQDFMIRAELYGPTGQYANFTPSRTYLEPAEPIARDDVYLATSHKRIQAGFRKSGEIIPLGDKTRSLSKYNLFLVSGFDPDQGEGPESGTPTSIGSTSAISYYDNFLKSPGFYAYAVEAEYDSGDKSSWAYSNIFSCGLDNVVDLRASLCDSSQADNVEYHAIGTNFPYQDILLMSDDSGLVVFDSLINGSYNIEVFKIGYEKVSLNDVLISTDSSLSVELYENTFSPRNLFVDSLTAVATWQPALVTALETEDFEGVQFPPEGWYQTIDLGDLSWWQRSNTGYNVPPQFEDGTSSWFAAGKKRESLHPGNSYLVTPYVDLRLSDSLYLTFDRYFDGTYGDVSRVFYSNNNGLDWVLLQELYLAQQWINQSIDLSSISGFENGNDSVVFAFSNASAGGYPAVFCVDNVSVHNGPAAVTEYDVYLNDGFAGSTAPDTLTYSFSGLEYGVEYTAKVRAVYSCGISDPISFTWTSSFLYPPRNLDHDYTYNTDEVLLKWNPPLHQANYYSNYVTAISDTAFIPAGLIGFNVYKNDELIGFQDYIGQAEDQLVYFLDNNVDPGTFICSTSAIYDLTPYGFAGDTAESMPSNFDTVKVVWGNSMPFFEGWEQADFDFQGWETSPGNWRISSQTGDDAPSAEFSWEPQLDTSYKRMLVSAPINADMIGIGDVFLDFDIKLDDRNAGNTEKMMIQVKKAGETNWHGIDTLYNNGSFDFARKHYDITSKSRDNVFKIRFVASGENSFNIISWYIDNINVYRTCKPPSGLNADYFWDADDDYGISLCWEAPQLPIYYLHWGDGVVFSGIGLDSGGVFSAAARWDADMLTDYDGLFATKIMFRLADTGFQKVIVKIWEGPDAGILLAEKLAVSPVVPGLNTVELDVPVPINVSKELWVGYTIYSDLASFPAAVDAGPAISGYGDKISLDGISWDNLSDFGLGYNWNIGVRLEELYQSYPRNVIGEAAYGNTGSKAEFVLGPIVKRQKTAPSYSERSLDGFNIYSKTGEDNEYGFVGFVPYAEGQSAYCYKFKAEDDVQSGKCYFYQVTSVNSSAEDQCESAPATAQDGEDYAYACVTGINEAYVPIINMYPNPALNTVNIRSISNINKIVVTNFLGQLIIEIKPSQRTSVILNTTSFPNGVYLVHIDTDNGVQTKKLSIAR